MFESLSDKLQKAFTGFKSKGHLTEDDINDGIREIRMALLEADVNYKVVKNFTRRVKERCLTAEELTASDNTPEKIKSLIDYRQKLFKMLLTQDETDNNTASKKLTLCQERLDILQQEVVINGEKKKLFEDNTLFASSWSQLQARYELLAKQKDWKTYLSVADVQNLNISGDALKSTLTANQQRAQKIVNQSDDEDTEYQKNDAFHDGSGCQKINGNRNPDDTGTCWKQGQHRHDRSPQQCRFYAQKPENETSQGSLYNGYHQIAFYCSANNSCEFCQKQCLVTVCQRNDFSDTCCQFVSVS